MGEDSAPKRDLGPWSVSEGVALFQSVCTATGVKAMRESLKLVIAKEEDAKKALQSGGKRYDLSESEGELRIYTPALV